MRNILRVLMVVLVLVSSVRCDEYDAFRGWLREGGAIFDKIDIKEFDNYGRGLVAIADIEVRCDTHPCLKSTDTSILLFIISSN